jgi:signal transduction histidine kinase/ActR/RegA family two-component response regulator
MVTERSFPPTIRLRSEQVDALFRSVVPGVMAAAAAAIVLVSALISLGALHQTVGIAWVLYIFACAVAHIALRYSYIRHKPDSSLWKRWADWFVAICLAEGIGWGWASISLAGNSGQFSLEMIVMIVTLSVAAGAIPTFGSYLPAFFALFFPTTIPCLIWGIENRTVFPEATMMYSLMAIFVTGMGVLGVRANHNFNELVRLRIKAGELALDLQEQKEVAERASLAKSQFLAAASHDLRQPVHALGLFVSALRAVSGLPVPALRILDRMELSTSAMGDLFSAILDISRLDAGVVEVRRQAFALQPLLDRVCQDFAEEAADKSIIIRQQTTAANVLSDPHLVERILRNLVSNAIRHSDQGRVVVGCRKRGKMVRLEVWDTGAGISPENQQKVFQEYIQLQNPERDRTRGLGLGLAIVRRLSELLDCELSLRSHVGRGSCFSVYLPLAEVSPVSSLAATEVSHVIAEGALILIIDDEVAVREAMDALLTGWGYGVLTAASGDEALTVLAESKENPRMIICDYRLRGEENGIEVIRLLQAECQQLVPAVLITGDTAEDRLIEAQASGLMLLHKPVHNSKLRAVIVNSMRVSNQADVTPEFLKAIK